MMYPNFEYTATTQNLALLWAFELRLRRGAGGGSPQIGRSPSPTRPQGRISLSDAERGGAPCWVWRLSKSPHLSNERCGPRLADAILRCVIPHIYGLRKNLTMCKARDKMSQKLRCVIFENRAARASVIRHAGKRNKGDPRAESAQPRTRQRARCASRAPYPCLLLNNRETKGAVRS